MLSCLKIKMPLKKENKLKELKCNQCDYVTHRKAFMDDHMRIHTGDRPYKCNECGKGFTQKSNLTKHMIVHGAGYKTEYKCDRCDFTTRYKQSLKMHQNWHSGVKPYVCDICERSFSQSTHRRTHMKEAHDDDRKYQCHFCSKCFKRKEHLEKHIAFHRNERNFACDVCGKTFIEEKHVSIHKLIHGGEETKVHKCDLCPYKSRYKQGLQVHYRIHLGVRPYTCEQCPKAFRTSQTLRIHSRMVHQGMLGKIFHCGMCDYRTANKQTLKNHIDNIHLGIKKKNEKYPCPYCGNVYLGHSSLHGHKRKKHPQKLKQEMQVRLQQRLAMIRSPEGKLHAPQGQGNTSVAIEDYRFKNPVHNLLKDCLATELDSPKDGVNMKKMTNRKSKTKASIPKRQGKKVGEKKKKGNRLSSNGASIPVSGPAKNKWENQPEKEPLADSTKSATGSTRKRKKPVHDLLQERIARKNELVGVKKSKVSKKIELNIKYSETNSMYVEVEATTPVSNKSDDVPSEKSQSNSNPDKEVPVPTKESYMSHLGLLQRAEPQAIETVRRSKSPVEYTGIRDQVPVIVIKPIGVLSSLPQSGGNNGKHPQPRTSLVSKQMSPKSGKSFPKIKPLNLSTKSKVSKSTKPASKSPKEKGQPKSPKKKVPKPKKSPPEKGSVSKPLKSSNSSLIVYEPVDVPSLGPYTKIEEESPAAPVDLYPMVGTMLEMPEIKEEKEDYMPVPLNYSINEFDSLRALASVYLEKSTA